MDDFYATVPYINQIDPHLYLQRWPTWTLVHKIIYFYPRVPTRHEYNYLITLTQTLTRVPTWHEYSDPGRAGIASQTRYTTQICAIIF